MKKVAIGILISIIYGISPVQTQAGWFQEQYTSIKKGELIKQLIYISKNLDFNKIVWCAILGVSVYFAYQKLYKPETTKKATKNTSTNTDTNETQTPITTKNTSTNTDTNETQRRITLKLLASITNPTELVSREILYWTHYDELLMYQFNTEIFTLTKENSKKIASYLIRKLQSTNYTIQEIIPTIYATIVQTINSPQMKPKKYTITLDIVSPIIDKLANETQKPFTVCPGVTCYPCKKPPLYTDQDWKLLGNGNTCGGGESK